MLVLGITLCLLLMGMIVYDWVCEFFGLLPPAPSCGCGPSPLGQQLIITGLFIFCLGLCISSIGLIIVLMSEKVKAEFGKKSKKESDI
jgi:hypothetical protein